MTTCHQHLSLIRGNAALSDLVSICLILQIKSMAEINLDTAIKINPQGKKLERKCQLCLLSHLTKGIITFGLNE